MIEQDLKHVWHPCSRIKDYEALKPVAIKRAWGAYFELEDGTELIDATSSWWCKALGHGHPRIQAAVMDQMKKFEHVLGAHTCQSILVQLSEKLSGLTQHLSRVFYAGDGSSAIEIAMKMSLHSRHLQGVSHRQKFMALSNSYHGETGLALSVSDLGPYRDPYQAVLMPVSFIHNIPYVHAKTDPLWEDCSSIWPAIEAQLHLKASELTAILVEPIVQGAGGMLIYSQDFLRRLRDWATQHDVHLIADEMMTGMGRTGKMLACEYSQVEPDFLCLGKGLTAGWFPMSAVLTREAIYQLFSCAEEYAGAFLHSHTYSGHALSASAALETLKIFEEEGICNQAERLEIQLKTYMDEVACATGCLTRVRALGGVVAADLVTDMSRKGFDVFQEAIKLGAFLRPLCNTIYWLPPLNVEAGVLEKLAEITAAAIKQACTVTRHDTAF